MAMLTDPTLDRLCDLFASGRMEHAKEIARLLADEIHQPRPDPETLASSELLRRAALALQTH
jgi:hypothetical protein